MLRPVKRLSSLLKRVISILESCPDPGWAKIPLEELRKTHPIMYLLCQREARERVASKGKP